MWLSNMYALEEAVSEEEAEGVERTYIQLFKDNVRCPLP
jgi:hypothetical protein